MVTEHISPETVVLLNKRDLVNGIRHPGLFDVQHKVWEASILQNGGMEDFLRGLSARVQER